MRIGELAGKEQVSPWEVVRDYRRSLSEGSDGTAIPAAAAAAGTGETPDTKRANLTQGCETCKNRTYQDGSADPGVSFKTPTRISPDQAATAVRGHEQEHVNREQGKAQREDREVVSQSVTYHTAICPECGRSYVAGGTTRTTTRGSAEPQAAKPQPQAPQKSGLDVYA